MKISKVGLKALADAIAGAGVKSMSLWFKQ